MARGVIGRATPPRVRLCNPISAHPSRKAREGWGTHCLVLPPAQFGSSVRAFLEVGNERKKLVHQDYATFAMDKTLDEMHRLYRDALPFVESLPTALRKSDAQPIAPESQPETARP